MDADSEDDAAAMAQAMGFSSFGMQSKAHDYKRRKFNPRADVTASSATGSNATSLGTPSMRQPPPVAENVDEIALDEEEDADQGSITQGQELPEQGVAKSEALVTSSATAPNLSLPARPPPQVLPTREPRLPNQGRSGNATSRQDGKAWYEGYYDPSTNENPWERLEKKMGLEPRGVWVARGQGLSTKT